MKKVLFKFNLMLFVFAFLTFIFSSAAFADTGYFKKLNLEELRCTNSSNSFFGSGIQLEIRVDGKAPVTSPVYNLYKGAEVSLDQPVYYVNTVKIKVWGVKYFGYNDLIKEIVIDSTTPSSGSLAFEGTKSAAYEISYTLGETSIKLGDNTISNLNKDLYKQETVAEQATQSQTQAQQTTQVSNISQNTVITQKDTIIKELSDKLFEKDKIIDGLYQQLKQKDVLINDLYYRLNKKATGYYPAKTTTTKK